MSTCTCGSPAPRAQQQAAFRQDDKYDYFRIESETEVVVTKPLGVELTERLRLQKSTSNGKAWRVRSAKVVREPNGQLEVTQ